VALVYMLFLQGIYFGLVHRATTDSQLQKVAKP
jgi:hypothetical protein